MSIVQQAVPLVLASGSAIRAQMLKSVGLQFSVVPSGFDETALKRDMQALPIGEQAQRLAQEKCLSVAKGYPEHVTFGADQICELDGEVIDKPGNKENAMAQLHRMRGKPHYQHSAVCVMRGEELVWETVECATLTMRDLSDEEVEAYVQHDQPFHSCGSYRLEGMGRHLFAAIEGDHDVIKGLPLMSLLNALYKYKIICIT